MRICLILEGCYPYVTGGVSSWMHQYIQAMPQHEFVLWTIGATSDMKGKFKYTLPENVVEVHELFLQDALKLTNAPKRYKFTENEMETLHAFVNCTHPDWDTLFGMYAQKRIDPMSFLRSKEFLDILTDICVDEYPHAAFSDFFHTVRSMMLPVLHILSSGVPKADLYHAIATGYAGVLARLGAYTYNAPYEITEHGIYTREREEEIIRENWVLPDFKRLWVRFFYMLSDCAYEKASKVTSLFSRARKIQISMGCDPDKCEYIGNGVHYERFRNLAQKEPNGMIDIGAVLRICPIKDVKTMIYAFSECKARVENCRLFIAGPEDDPVYAKECYELIEQLQVKDVYFMGTINVLEHLGKFDFTVLSSISEGMPLSVLESFSAGKPCITTDVGSCKELLGGVAPDDDFGAAGFVVPPMDPMEMANAMVRMCTQNEMRLQMGEAGRRRVEKYFLHETMMERYEKIYQEVLDGWHRI